MYTTPIILLVGQAGSGKDTVAGFMVKNHGAVSIAQADPMKRLAKHLFEFTDEQLWGPSECRNAPDNRFYNLEAAARNPWIKVWNAFDDPLTDCWLADLFPGKDIHRPREALRKWVFLVGDEAHVRPLTPRFVLQTLGTEWGRRMGRDVWSDYAINNAFELLGGGYRYDRAKGLVVDAAAIGPGYVVISDGRFRNEVINVRKVGGSVIRIDSPSVDTSAVEAAGVKGHASEAEQKSLPEHFFTHFFPNNKKYGLDHCEVMVNRLMEVVGANLTNFGQP